MSQIPTMTEPKVAGRPAPAPRAELAADTLDAFRQEFDADRTCRLAQNAVTQTGVDDVALNRSVITAVDHSFSHKLDDWPVTDQKKSGRCWLFAGLNLFRAGAISTMNVESFEFSQNHAMFWDKFERANHFLEAIIETADRPTDDRTVAYLLDRPLDDGGQWNMFVNIVRKHGLVPKVAMPESQSSSDTRRMNGILVRVLRDGARTLRELRGSGGPMEAARARKLDILQAVYRILCIHLGSPPESIDWQWHDKDKAFHRDGRLTPLEFARRYVTVPLEEYVCLVHDPRQRSPMNRTFTVQHLGNVVGGDRVLYLNVPLELMKQLARDAIVGGEPVWFGCDVGPMMRRDLGIWDRDLYDYEGLYGIRTELGKAERLEYHQSCMTHAMLFTGVDVVEDRSRRWRVENSWGEENGQKGFYVMNDSWFDEYVFETAARRSALPAELQAALEEEPIVLPPWDPMGALARGERLSD
jgi:bleomycin hydrolase